mgnify:CR=1 FL=1
MRRRDPDGRRPGLLPGGRPARAAGEPPSEKVWEPVSDRKLRFGIVGYGVCRFGAAFSFQDHPNVEIVAVADCDDNCPEDDNPGQEDLDDELVGRVFPSGASENYTLDEVGNLTGFTDADVLFGTSSSAISV